MTPYESVGVLVALWLSPLAFAVGLAVTVRLARRTGALDREGTGQ